MEHQPHSAPHRPIHRLGLRATLIAAGVLVAVVLLVVLIVLITTGWGPLHTLDLNIVQSFNRYAAHDPGQVRPWKIVSIIGGPTVLRMAALLAVVLLGVHRRWDAAVLVVVAIGRPAALSGINCWSTGAVNLSGKRHVFELFGRFDDLCGRSAVARLTPELTFTDCAIRRAKNRQIVAHHSATAAYRNRRYVYPEHVCEGLAKNLVRYTRGCPRDARRRYVCQPR